MSTLHSLTSSALTTPFSSSARCWAWCPAATTPGRWRKRRGRWQAEPAWETALVAVFGRPQTPLRHAPAAGRPARKRPPGGPPALRTALRRHGLHALQPKAFTPRTTDSTHGLRCAPNRLLDQPHPPRPTGSGSATSRICRWPTAPGPTCAPFRTCAASTWWAGTCGPTCPKSWSPAPCSGLFWPNGPPPAWSSTPTGAGSTGQRLQGPAARGPGPALAQPPRRLLRQCPGRKPVVAPQNRGARSPRLARFCRPGRCPGQRRRLF